MLNNDFRIFYEFIIKFCYQIVINIFIFIFIFIFIQFYFYLIFILFKPKIIENGGRKKATSSSLNRLSEIFISNLKWMAKM